MDATTLNRWRQSIKEMLGKLAAIPFPDVVQLTCKTVFDETSDNYLVMMEGWKGVRRLHGCLVHLEIKDDKIWIHQDGTEFGMAGELLACGVPKDRIVLAFRSPQSRANTGFAVA